MDFPGAHNVRRRPQGLGVARDVSALRFGVLSLSRPRPVPVRDPLTTTSAWASGSRSSSVGAVWCLERIVRQVHQAAHCLQGRLWP
jgi:hypothetical protein